MNNENHGIDLNVVFEEQDKKGKVLNEIVEEENAIKIKVNGEELKMSLNHRMLVFRDGELQYIEAKDILKTDKLVKLITSEYIELEIESIEIIEEDIDIELKELVINMLKLQDKEVTNIEGNVEKIKVNNLEVSIIYDNSKNLEAEKEMLQKEYSMLESSIARREKLLSNEAYLNKAPTNVVEAEKEALNKELERLKIIKNKMGEV